MAKTPEQKFRINARVIAFLSVLDNNMHSRPLGTVVRTQWNWRMETWQYSVMLDKGHLGQYWEAELIEVPDVYPEATRPFDAGEQPK